MSSNYQSEDKDTKSIKYTFVNANEVNQTVLIPQTYIDQQKRSLGCTHSEACHMYLFDNDFVSNDTAQELTEKAKSNKVNCAGTATNIRKPVSRKEDPVKRALIESLSAHISTLDNIAEMTTLNPERLISFKIGNDTYELTLAKKRKA